MSLALLVIDVQQALCSGEWAAFDIENIVARINSVSTQVRMAGSPVVFIQHEESEGPLQFGAAGWQICDRLEIRPEDLRIRKTTPDSFHKTDLESELKSRGIDRLVICGLQSDFCVDSTVRGALARGYPVTLLADAHSTVDNGVLTASQISAHHNATLSNLCSFGPRVNVVPSGEFQIVGSTLLP